MLTKTGKTCLTVATVLCVFALLCGIVATCVAISACVTAARITPADSINVGAIWLVFILFFFLQGCFLMASIPFYAIGLLRAPRSKGRLIATWMLVAQSVLFVINAVFSLIAL